MKCIYLGWRGARLDVNPMEGLTIVDSDLTLLDSWGEAHDQCLKTDCGIVRLDEHLTAAAKRSMRKE